MTIYSIYKITNSANNKVYIGWTSREPQLRFEEHQKPLKPKHQDRSAISYAIEKHGVECFVFEVIYQSLDEQHSKDIEAYFIAEYNSLVEQWGYNRDAGGTGHKRTRATIEKHREKIKGQKQSPEHIEKRFKHRVNPMAGKTGEKHPRYGLKHSEDTKAKIRAAKALKPKMCEEEKRRARVEYSRRFREKHKQ
jgi:group I intron endonuclease